VLVLRLLEFLPANKPCGPPPHSDLRVCVGCVSTIRWPIPARARVLQLWVLAAGRTRRSRCVESLAPVAHASTDLCEPQART
jgi:hypothetical protein